MTRRYFVSQIQRVMKKNAQIKNKVYSVLPALKNLFISTERFVIGLIPLSTKINPRKSITRSYAVLAGMLLFFTLQAQPPMLRLQMSGPNNSLDETVLYYQDGASLGFDSDFDAYKLLGPNQQSAIGIKYDNILFQINGIQPVQQFVSVPVLVTAAQTGTFVLFATDFNDMPYGTCIKLVDTYNGNVTDITGADYTFTSYDTTTAPRFLIEIDYMNMPVATQLIQANCSNPLGNFVVNGVGSGAWDYTWKDAFGNVLKTTLNSSVADTLNPAGAGNYEVLIENALGCGQKLQSFTIDSVALPIASFGSADTIVLGSQEQPLTLNTSVNATGYLWSFGDSTTGSTDVSANHIYEAAGDYTIQLVAYSSMGCSDTALKTIVVMDTTSSVTDTVGTTNQVGFKNESRQTIKWCTIGEHVFLVYNPEGAAYQLEIFDISGKKVFSEKVSTTNRVFELGSLSKGTYTVILSTGTSVQKTLCLLF